MHSTSSSLRPVGLSWWIWSIRSSFWSLSWSCVIALKNGSAGPFMAKLSDSRLWEGKKKTDFQRKMGQKEQRGCVCGWQSVKRFYQYTISTLKHTPNSPALIGSFHGNTFSFDHRGETWNTKTAMLKVSYQSDLGYFRNVCLARSWCVCGSAEMPCALRVRGPISCALGRTDWHLCSFLFNSWISSSRSASLLSRSRILSSFSSKILVKSSSRSLMLKILALNFANLRRELQLDVLFFLFWGGSTNPELETRDDAPTVSPPLSFSLRTSVRSGEPCVWSRWSRANATIRQVSGEPLTILHWETNCSRASSRWGEGRPSNLALKIPHNSWGPPPPPLAVQTRHRGSPLLPSPPPPLLLLPTNIYSPFKCASHPSAHITSLTQTITKKKKKINCSPLPWRHGTDAFIFCCGANISEVKVIPLWSPHSSLQFSFIGPYGSSSVKKFKFTPFF